MSQRFSRRLFVGTAAATLTAPSLGRAIEPVKIRVPRVILLLMFDRLPKKEVKFTRHNIFERDRVEAPSGAHTGS